MNNYEKTTEKLRELGIRPNISGYIYLREAILMVADDPLLINVVTKEIYPTVASKFEKTPSQIERAMRHAIEVAWKRQSEQMIKMFKNLSYGRKPDNSLFIALLAEDIRMDSNV